MEIRAGESDEDWMGGLDFYDHVDQPDTGGAASSGLFARRKAAMITENVGVNSEAAQCHHSDSDGYIKDDQGWRLHPRRR